MHLYFIYRYKFWFEEYDITLFYLTLKLTNIFDDLICGIHALLYSYVFFMYEC